MVTIITIERVGQYSKIFDHSKQHLNLSATRESAVIISDNNNLVENSNCTGVFITEL